MIDQAMLNLGVVVSKSGPRGGKRWHLPKRIPVPTEEPLTQQINRQWKVIERIREEGLKTVRLELGREFLKLRGMYSHKSNTRTSAHPGTFEKECEKRGFKHRTVCDWIKDYEASQKGGKTTAEQKKDRRKERQGLRGEAQPGQDREFVFPCVIVTEEEEKLIDLLDPEEIKTLLLEAARKKREKKTAKTRSARAGA